MAVSSNVEKGNLYHDKRAQWAMYVLLFVALAAIPFFVDDAFTLNQFSRYAVLALLSVSVSLVWGFGGILSLGQGIAFGMAAYCMGATMQMQSQDPVSDPIPSFMLTNELNKLPFIWEPFWNTGAGLALAFGLPTLFFVVFGYMMFKARLAGGFVAIMTLAMLGAWYSMAYDMQPFTGGFNGISPPNAFKMLGITFDPYSPLVYWVAVGALALCTIVVKLLLQSKFGVIVQAIRNDAERARFLGYSVSFYQVVVFTLSGIIAAIAGVLWVMIVQYVSPTSLEVTFSISMVIWAALGGRLSLFGAIIGALFVNSVQSYLGDELQATYFVILGAIFVLVVRFLPKGIAGLFETVIGYIPYRRAPSTGVGKAPSAAR